MMPLESRGHLNGIYDLPLTGALTLRDRQLILWQARIATVAVPLGGAAVLPYACETGSTPAQETADTLPYAD